LKYLIFAEEPGQPYAVQAQNARYMICTRPMTKDDAEDWGYRGSIDTEVIYTIVDTETGRRGPHNAIFNIYELNTKAGCEKCLKDFTEPGAVLKVTERPSKYLPTRIVSIWVAADETA